MLEVTHTVCQMLIHNLCLIHCWIPHIDLIQLPDLWDFWAICSKNQIRVICWYTEYLSCWIFVFACRSRGVFSCLYFTVHTVFHCLLISSQLIKNVHPHLGQNMISLSWSLRNTGIIAIQIKHFYWIPSRVLKRRWSWVDVGQFA